MADPKTIAAENVPADEAQGSGMLPVLLRPSLTWRLHRHADYQRVYKATRKQFASLMSYFAVARKSELAHVAAPPGTGPRIGLTAGRVLGNAVERNRIKRRMRAAVRQNLSRLTVDVDLVLHPKRTVLEAEFGALNAEVRRIFLKVEQQIRAEQAKGLAQRMTP